VWIEQDLNLMSKHIFPFVMEIVHKSHESSGKKAAEVGDELVDSSLFSYAIELCNKCIDKAQELKVTTEEINLDFINFLMQILYESKEINIQVNLLKLLTKTTEALLDTFIESSDSVEKLLHVIAKFLNPEETYESAILNLGNLIVLYLSKVSRNPVDDFTQMTAFLLQRLSI
jgi:hypothetical protein